MSWVTIIMDPDDKKVKIDWFYPKRIVFSTIWGDQFLYISLELDYRHSSCCYSVFLLILHTLFLVHSLFFILLHSFHLHLPCVDQIVVVDPCPISTFMKSLGLHLHLSCVDQIVVVDPYPISTFLKSLGVVVRLKITVQVSLPY